MRPLQRRHQRARSAVIKIYRPGTAIAGYRVAGFGHHVAAIAQLHRSRTETGAGTGIRIDQIGTGNIPGAGANGNVLRIQQQFARGSCGSACIGDTAIDQPVATRHFNQATITLLASLCGHGSQEGGLRI